MRYPAFSLSLLTLLCVFSFQNCNGFKAQDGTFSRSSESILPLPDPTPGPTPEPTPAPKIRTTRFFLSGVNRFSRVELDHQTEQINYTATIPLNEFFGGSIAVDKSARRLIASDLRSARVASFIFDPLSGELGAPNFLNFTRGAGHINFVKKATGEYMIFGTNGALSVITAAADFSTANTPIPIPTESAHSSAYDAKNGLVYSAILGSNLIQVTSLDGVAIGTIPVVKPRTVIWDETYQKLYVSTESRAGAIPSFIKIYSTQYANGVFSSEEVGSAPMSAVGSDVRVNHAFGYVFGLSRQAGDEQMVALPITQKGAGDSTRPILTVKLNQAFPQSIDFSEDGLYAVVSASVPDPRAILIYRLAAPGGLLTATEIKAIADNQGFLSSGAFSAP